MPKVNFLGFIFLILCPLSFDNHSAIISQMFDIPEQALVGNIWEYLYLVKIYDSTVFQMWSVKVQIRKRSLNFVLLSSCKVFTLE